MITALVPAFDAKAINDTE